MSPIYPTTDLPKEPRQRFYPTQGTSPGNQPQIPSAPTPPSPAQTAPVSTLQYRANASSQMPERHSSSYKKSSDASYLMHRHPILLKRLYSAADNLLDAYPTRDFIYDAYPDYVSLRLMRDRLLRENRTLTEEFLQSGCPILWLELLTDTILSELLCRKRCS